MSDSQKKSIRFVATQYILPYLLITSLFFMWGGARAVMDVLNKHFQMSMGVSKTQSALMQVMVYGAYFLMALPSGWLIKRFGTRRSIVMGLLTFVLGSLLFVPASYFGSFDYVLFPLFVIGCGLVVLETAANPYVTLLGDPSTAASRLNLSQSFNGLGCIVGVFLGGQFFFSGENADISIPYLCLGGLLFVVAMVFTRVKLPEVVLNAGSDYVNDDKGAKKHLGGLFFFGFMALLAYEIAEISINTFFINYMSDDGFLTPKEASVALSIAGLGLFMCGRLIGSALMKRFSAERVLLSCAIGAIIMILMVIIPMGVASRVALVVCYLFESIMFPTIFALSIRGLGNLTDKASSILMMTVVGGAIGPLCMGWVGDIFSMSIAFMVPLIAFIVVGMYAGFQLMHSNKIISKG